MSTTTEKYDLTTAEVSEKLGLHRNTLLTFKEELKPKKALNGRDNVYDPDIVEAFLQKRLKANPRIDPNCKVKKP